MKKRIWIFLAILAIPILVFANFKGDMIKWGINSTQSGDASTVTIKEDLTVNDDLTVTDDLTIGGDVAVTGSVAYAGVDTSDDITLENDEIISNDTDGDIDLIFDDYTSPTYDMGELNLKNSTGHTSDAAYFTLNLLESKEESGTTDTVWAYLRVLVDDATFASADSTISFAVYTAGTFVRELNLTGAMLYPHANSGLNLGSDANEFGDAWIDGTAYLDTVDIDAGAIDGTAIGAASESTGKFSTLESQSTATLATVIAEGNITQENGAIIDNSADGIVSLYENNLPAAETTAIYDLRLGNSAALTTDASFVSISAYVADDDTSPIDLEVAADIRMIMDDISSDTEDVTIAFGVMTNGTWVRELNLLGPRLAPHANAGLDLGSDALEFNDVWIDGTAYLDTVDIDAGAIDGTIIGATVATSATFTNTNTTGTATIATVDINAGAIDGATIGASSVSTVKGTTLESTGTTTVGTDLILTTGQEVQGSRHTISVMMTASTLDRPFWIAPAACTIVNMYEVHGTVAGQACEIQLEELTTGQDSGAGVDLLAGEGWDFTSTVDTPVTATSDVTIAAGSFIGTVTSGTATSYDEGCITLEIEWL
jgi:hypothetical protein